MYYGALKGLLDLQGQATTRGLPVWGARLSTQVWCWLGWKRR